MQRAQFMVGLLLALLLSLAMWESARRRQVAAARAHLPPVRCVGDARAEGLAF